MEFRYSRIILSKMNHLPSGRTSGVSEHVRHDFERCDARSPIRDSIYAHSTRCIARSSSPSTSSSKPVLSLCSIITPRLMSKLQTLYSDTCQHGPGSAEVMRSSSQSNWNPFRKYCRRRWFIGFTYRAAERSEFQQRLEGCTAR